MHVLHVVVIASAWLIALAWLYKLIEAALGLSAVPNLLAQKYDVEPAGGPSITVIVPARNEELHVAACLESLARQDYGNLRVVVVDDRSTDGTWTIVDRIAKTHAGRVEALHVAELPAGWLGKPHAMALAARHVAVNHPSDYLLFTDADIVFRRDAIRRSLAEAVAEKADHFVVMPTTVAKTRGEGVMLAYIQTMSLFAVRTWRVADPKAKRDAIGVGAFNLLRREVYERLGGFEAAPMEILEDLTLGQRVKRVGLRQRVATAPGMVCVHWAPGVLGLVYGLTKNVFAVFRFRPVLLILSAAWVGLFSLLPLAFLGAASTRVPGLMALVSLVGLYVLSSRTSRLSPAYAGLFPVAALLVVYSMVRSMAITLWNGGVTWRGTFYPLADLRTHVRATKRLIGR